MAPMVGKREKPFCGDCCSEYPKGSGKAHKRKIKKVVKAREKRLWKKDTWQD